MKLDLETLSEIEDHIQALDGLVGLKPETINDLAQAIGKYKDSIKKLNLNDDSFYCRNFVDDGFLSDEEACDEQCESCRFIHQDYMEK